MPHKDPEVRKKYLQEWYARNRDYMRSRSKQYAKDNPGRTLQNQRQRQNRNRDHINSIKLHLGCKHCGYKDDTSRLHFHHVNPDDKGGELNKAINLRWSISRIDEEISKCILLCKSCHTREHWRLFREAGGVGRMEKFGREIDSTG